MHAVVRAGEDSTVNINRETMRALRRHNADVARRRRRADFWFTVVLVASVLVLFAAIARHLAMTR